MGISARALRAGRAIIELGLVTGPVEKGLKRLQLKLRSIAAQFSKLGTFGIGGGGLGGFAGLRNLFISGTGAAAAAWPVKLAANMELATEQMAVFTGSTESARKVLMDLMEFSAVASQSPEELATQLRLLMTRDLLPDQALQDLKELAVLAAGSTDEFQQLTKAFADVRSATRLNGEEMRQFKNTAFNPLAEIAKHTGETMDQVKDRMEAGGVSFEEVESALHAVTRQGGRFHGMLERISGTLIGKVRQAFAALKMAVLPIGDVLLKPFKDFLDILLRAAPGIKKFINNNKELAAGIVLAAIKIAVLATVFVTVGLAGTVASIALAGLVNIAAVLVGAIGFMLTPLGWLTAALIFVAYKTITASGALKKFAAIGKAVFGAFGNTISMAVKGISDALHVEDIQGAMRILTSALSLLWLQFTTGLSLAWIRFKDTFLQVTERMIQHAIQLFAKFLQWFTTNFPKLSGLLGIQFETQDILTLGAVSVKIAKIFADIRANLGEGMEDVRKKLQEAEAAFKGIVEGAAKGAAPPGGKDWFDAPFQWAQGIQNALGDSKGASALSFFDPRLSQQMIGGEAIAKEQLGELRDINKNTRRRGGGGLPFV